MSSNEATRTEVSDRASLLSHAETVYDLVWRTGFSAPGFASLEIPPGPDSHDIRAWMIALKIRLSEISLSKGREPFVYRSMSRFDQQVTTKFHLDGAPDQSLLMLGYEPSKIESRLFLADYSDAAADLGITPKQFLQDYNPMFKKGEESLQPYTTELPPQRPGYSRIVLINNSSTPISPDGMTSLGVMHKAIIVTPNDTEPRLVNSTMLAVGGDELSEAIQHEFVHTTEISKRNY